MAAIYLIRLLEELPSSSRSVSYPVCHTPVVQHVQLADFWTGGVECSVLELADDHEITIRRAKDHTLMDARTSGAFATHVHLISPWMSFALVQNERLMTAINCYS